MMSPDNQLRNILKQLIDTAEHAISYVEGLEKADFLADRKTQDAVILNILVIGELAAKVLESHPEFGTQHSQIPWWPMKGMRNRIAHGYFDVNLDTVWVTVQHDIPALAKDLRLVLPPE